MSKIQIFDQLEEFYNGEVPEYVVKAGKSFITIRISDWTEVSQDLKIRVEDVAEYYATQAPNIVSGCRTLAGFVSDWRPVDNLAKEALEWFKFVNVEAIRREGKKRGIEPKF